MRTVLVTWNLKGSAGPDLAAIAAHIRAQDADVVALQEVQWHQARRIARALGARSRRWSLKHWPIRTWPEGMAVIGVTRDVRVRARALSYRWRPWSWRRRILQFATVEGTVTGTVDTALPAGEVARFTLVNAHLTPHGRADLRTLETRALVAVAAHRSPGEAVVVAGDLNERPGGPVHRQLAAAGLRDGWVEQPGATAPPTATPDPAPTNWRGWQRGTTAAPAQTLDYVYVSPAVTSVVVQAPRMGDDGFALFAALSDHLPVTAVFTLPASTG